MRAFVDTFMPEGYTIGDEPIVLANDGRLRHLNSVWPSNATTYDVPATPQRHAECCRSSRLVPFYRQFTQKFHP